MHQKEILGAVLWFGCGAAITLYVKKHMLDRYKIEGRSMEGTLSPGQHVWVFKRPYYYPQRGEVVAYLHPQKRGQIVTKRIIALEGDVVRTETEQGDRDLATVPKGHVWCEGDFKEISLDSRHYGAIPIPLIKGSVVVADNPLRFIQSKVKPERLAFCMDVEIQQKIDPHISEMVHQQRQ